MGTLSNVAGKEHLGVAIKLGKCVGGSGLGSDANGSRNVTTQSGVDKDVMATFPSEDDGVSDAGLPFRGAIVGDDPVGDFDGGLGICE